MADFPVIGNVYLLTRGVAKLFNSGKLAGCVVSDELLAQCEKYAAGPDKGQVFFRELAAKQLAVFRGLGFAAGYLGGVRSWKPSARSSTWPRATGPTIGGSSSRKFGSRSRTSSSSSSTIPRRGWRARIVSIRSSSLRWPARPKSKEVTLSYRLSRLVHRLAFTPRQGALRLDAAAVSALGQEARHQRPSGLFAGKDVETRPVWMPGLRRLQPAGVRAIFARGIPVPSAAATAPAAVRPMDAASWTTRSASGPGFTSD